ncbi:hypothetical protein [Ammoniphilus sp. CFH 90114]|uniref:hypothetical protein n=1 Tax=Ammoniphilus sp. CFH 90114 TaxID=2493665 RepID=UPI00100F08EA|nr:hypothetical protein [Ammoniphilus sp. CFH 90114]RXT14883.1 hypothetical protein EIZ39_01335 [Ammoniphilus sp. CFH 90114]
MAQNNEFFQTKMLHGSMGIFKMIDQICKEIIKQIKEKTAKPLPKDDIGGEWIYEGNINGFNIMILHSAISIQKPNSYTAFLGGQNVRCSLSIIVDVILDFISNLEDILTTLENFFEIEFDLSLENLSIKR